MKIYETVAGNIFADSRWRELLRGFSVELVEVSAATARSARFIAKGNCGNDFAVSLHQGRLRHGDILLYDRAGRRAAVATIQHAPVLQVELPPAETHHAWQSAIELGSYLERQKWQWTAKETKIYIAAQGIAPHRRRTLTEQPPLSRMRCRWCTQAEVGASLTPDEQRRLFSEE